MNECKNDLYALQLKSQVQIITTATTDSQTAMVLNALHGLVCTGSSCDL